MAIRKRETLINLTIFFCSLIISLLIVEVLFYNYFPQPTYAVQFCPWGFEHIPNISFKHTPESKETISYIRYNSEGFRGPTEYLIPKPDDTLRVAILGDSYAEGAEVDFDYLHGTVLEEMLNAYLNKSETHYIRSEVIKAGVYAYDSCQELRLFEERVIKYKPDLVFIIYTGELQENSNFCQLENQTLSYLDMSYNQFQHIQRYILGYLKAKSHFFNYINRVYRYHFGGQIHLPEQLNKTFSYTPPDSQEFINDVIESGKVISDYLKFPEEINLKTLPSNNEDQLLHAIFKQFDSLVTSYGGNLYVVFSHNKPESYGLGYFLNELNIGHFDIHSYINDHRTKATHLQIDGHWNEYGHFLVGRGLYELIIDMYH